MGKRFPRMILFGAILTMATLAGRPAQLGWADTAAAAQGEAPLNAQISVDPPELAASVPMGGVTSLQLTIGNTGSTVLDWEIAEEPVALNRAGGAAGPAAPQVVLYDQSDLAGTDTILSQEFEPALNNYTSQAADDFTIFNPTGWTIETVVVAGAYFNGTGPMPAVNVAFYSDSTGLPGEPIYSFDGLTSFTDVAGDLTIDLSASPAVLPPGTFWVSVQTDMDFNPNGQWGWTGRLMAAGSLAVWRNPGNGYGTNCTNWSPRWLLCAIGINSPDQVFQLLGEVGGLELCQPTDLTWLSAAPASGDVEAGAEQIVQVTLTAGGLAPGTYQGTLCISSNDPLNPVVRVPVTLTVTPPVPAISLTKTVGRDAGECATSDEVTVAAGMEVTYCYRVTNTGSVALGLHDLEDDQLGSLLDGLGFWLVPGASIFVTETTTISQTTTNTGLWTAYNPGGGDLVTSEDTAVANVGMAPEIDVQPPNLGSSQPPSMQVTAALTIANAGNENLSWSLSEETGPPGRSERPMLAPAAPLGACVPSEIGWLAASPTSGLVGPYGSATVQVTFNSAGLGVGLYNATLCVTSNDSGDPTVRVPVTLQVIQTPAPSIALGLTVGLQPNACSGTNSLILPSGGGDVTYCYWVHNTGNVSFSLHDLVDSAAGTLLTDYPYQLNPGQSLAMLWDREVTETTIHLATWTAGLTAGVNASDDALAVVSVLTDDGRRVLMPVLHRP